MTNTIQAGRKEKLKFDKFEVEIDPENLRFNEDSLNLFIQKEAGFYDNFGAYLALAERNLQNKEVAFEKVYCDRFVEAKEEGASDKLAEAKAKADPDVNVLKTEITEARYAVSRLKNHLKAWDKAHDNAQSMGHMLRKQMDKLNGDIMMGGLGAVGGMGGRYTHHDNSHPVVDREPDRPGPVQDGPSGGFETTLSNDMFTF